MHTPTDVPNYQLFCLIFFLRSGKAWKWGQNAGRRLPQKTRPALFAAAREPSQKNLEEEGPLGVCTGRGPNKESWEILFSSRQQGSIHLDKECFFFCHINGSKLFPALFEAFFLVSVDGAAPKRQPRSPLISISGEQRKWMMFFEKATIAFCGISGASKYMNVWISPF